MPMTTPDILSKGRLKNAGRFVYCETKGFGRKLYKVVPEASLNLR